MQPSVTVAAAFLPLQTFSSCCISEAYVEGRSVSRLPSMVRISVLGDALKTMYNAEKRGKRQVLIRPSSRVVIKFLQVMMKKGTSLSRLSELHLAAFQHS